MTDSQAKTAAVEALRSARRSTDIPDHLVPHHPTPGAPQLRSGATTPDTRTPKQRAAEQLRTTTPDQ